MLFLATSNEQSKNVIQKAIPLTIASKTIKYLGRNLNKSNARLVKWKLQNIVERNWKIPKEEHLIFIAWKTKYCYNDNTF